MTSLLTPSILLDLLLLLFTVSFFYVQYSFSYWKRKRVPFLKPTFPYGNIKDIVKGKKQLGFVLQDIYNKLKKRGEKYGGFYFFTKPVFLPIDREIVKHVMSASFKHFHDRGLFYDEKNDPVSAHLFALAGQKWKRLRQKLTPTFSSKKLKMMFQTVLNCADHFDYSLEGLVETGKSFDIKELTARYTTDIIVSCAFGLQSDCLKDFKKSSDFLEIGHKITAPVNVLKTLKYIFLSGFPRIGKLLQIKMDQQMSAFFMKLTKEIIEYREKNNIDRKDFMNLLLQLKNKGQLDTEDTNVKNDVNIEKLTVEEIAAQCFIFFVAGFETSSSTMSFLLYEISQNEEIQSNLRKEIRDALKKYSGKITYECINEMVYLERIIQETLRKYPPLPFFNRQCTADFKIPNSDIVITEGTQVMVPTLALHYDSDVFPEPHVFNPDRFLKPIPEFAHIPFGEGPHICIGLRFGMIQIKVGLAKLLSEYKFSLDSNTGDLEYLPSSFLLSPINAILLHVSKVNQK